MRNKILIGLGTALILGTLGLITLFGSALAQPVLQANGTAQVTEEGEGASCHAGMDSENGGQHMLGTVASALGITDDQLRAELDAGATLSDIARARGFDDAKLSAAMTGAMRDAMQRHVEDGLLTQEQADAMLKHMDGLDLSQFSGMLDGQMPDGMMDGLSHDDMMNGGAHDSMMGRQDHAGMMGGQGHGGMMGGASLPGMMDAPATDADEDSGSCHVDFLAGESV